MAEPMATGTFVGGFRIDSVLGEGATGSVYLAHGDRGERVALKLLSAELAQDARFRRRFLRESHVAATLDHPNVVGTLASGEDEGALYLAMDYVEGSDLRELLRREGALDSDRALGLIAQIADALDAAHAAGLVHRDVKPRNVLVTSGPEGEHAYVCDFGLARHVSSPSSLTGDRGFVGTIDYVSPEQIEGGEIDRRADVYSLGCVLYECMTGSRPFDRDSELSVVFAHLNEPPPRVTDLRPELPVAFDAVFATALAKAPDERFSSCGELVEAARAARRGRIVAGRRRHRRRNLVAAAVALAAAGVTAGGLLVTRSGSADAGSPAITPTSIAGARLGLRRGAYEKLFGEPGLLVYQQRDAPGAPGTGYATLAFEDRKVWIFFSNGIKSRANIITTWNKDYRTAAGIGPCSTVDELKAAYDGAVRPDRFGTIRQKHFVYDLGKNLLFAAEGIREPPARPSKFISTVGLFNGSAPHADEDQGPRPFARFVTGQESPACRPS